MRRVFGGEKPVLALTSLQNDGDKRVQEGFNHLYAGSMQALRNPRAHEVTYHLPEIAIELITWVHYLLRMLDQVTITPPAHKSSPHDHYYKHNNAEDPTAPSWRS